MLLSIHSEFLTILCSQSSFTMTAVLAIHMLSIKFVHTLCLHLHCPVYPHSHMCMFYCYCTGQSPLRVYQGRIFGSPVEVEVFPVQGLATVELVANGPTYYLDCNTSRNDGSGIMWRRIGAQNRFSVSDVASSASKRLSLARLAESDLGLYECFDSQSGAGDRAIVNITTGKYFSMIEQSGFCCSTLRKYNHEPIRQQSQYPSWYKIG